MSTWSHSHGAHRGAFPVRRSRRFRGFASVCEPLESRQLLSTSVFPAAIAAGEAARPGPVQPSLSLTPLSSSGSPTGLSPGQLTAAYGANQIGFKGNIVGNGAGQTIAIIDAYNDPNIISDLSSFDAQYGLAAPPSFTRYVESGLTQNDAGWALETALDVEWAHAVAPGANLVLVEANPNDLFSAVNFARQLPGVSVVSMSWGTGEFWGENYLDSLFTTPAGHTGGAGLPGGITFVASSGDSGAWYGTQYPADSPNVLAVGGTSLQVGTQGSYLGETAWSGSTGGYSLLEPAPSYQAGISNPNAPNYGLRMTPDVAWNADPATGVSVYNSVPYGQRTGWFTVGGTSASAPAWAGLIAIADQGLALAGKGSLANAQASLYRLPSADFNQITTGSNGYDAGSGYNLVTGLGSPKANLVVTGLVSANGGSSALISNPNGHASVTVSPSPHDVVIIITPPPTSPIGGTGSGSGSGSTSSTGSGSSTAIAPLTPVVLAGSNNRAPIIVIIVPQPLVARLGPSSAPVTTQSILSVVANEEQPTISTHFGQPETDQPDESELVQPIARPTRGPASLDVIEPFQPVAPEVPQEGQPAAPPNAARSRALPVLFGPALPTVLDLSVADLFSESPATSTPWADRPEEIRPSCGFSTIFGAAALAAGGYHLVLRPSDRFRGRWIPGRMQAGRRKMH